MKLEKKKLKEKNMKMRDHIKKLTQSEFQKKNLNIYLKLQKKGI
jgi:hypothetical protein